MKLHYEIVRTVVVVVAICIAGCGGGAEPDSGAKAPAAQRGPGNSDAGPEAKLDAESPDTGPNAKPGPKPNPKPNPNADPPSATTVVAAAGDDGAPTTDEPAASRGKIGVAACDEYIAKYSTCIDDKVPADIRGLMRDAIAQSEKVWKEEAAGPTKDRLPATCRTALDAAKQATAKFGCTW